LTTWGRGKRKPHWSTGRTAGGGREKAGRVDSAGPIETASFPRQ